VSQKIDEILFEAVASSLYLSIQQICTEKVEEIYNYILFSNKVSYSILCNTDFLKKIIIFKG